MLITNYYQILIDNITKLQYAKDIIVTFGMLMARRRYSLHLPEVAFHAKNNAVEREGMTAIYILTKKQLDSEC